ncbi:hypothetical protein A1O1_01215 [Capronia coronata CBS 617.96]|uniref:Major facilitator superfamily (MFS) profile domain-containing protein n=1 Tax=Capronia coronata CBS 617.96 TaxID=1182541 RepID=W9ZNN0_9EURO|nr:uncharacterized protein A1O1_01215 [Capronia coronata CBS 617.96]EXJ96089.1 hypothetical protein A1O1_01215 [Capronia coronata CBS 617.96]
MAQGAEKDVMSSPSPSPSEETLRQPQRDQHQHQHQHQHQLQVQHGDEHSDNHIDIESIRSSEEPVPVLEPPPHHHHHHLHKKNNQYDDVAENGIRYEYLTFETEIVFDEICATSNIPPPNLKKYQSPLTWSATHKTIILILSCYCTFMAAYSAGAYSIASAPQRAKWHVSEVVFNTGVTTWCLGFATSPMILAPFSEINGRRPVFIGSAVMFMAGLIACATTPSFAGMLVARFFVGAGASTFATMVGGVVSDLYDARHRNTPMAVYSGSALVGTGLGPLCSGFIVGRANFRWVYYHQIISLGIMLVVVYLFFKETRGSVLLSRKAKVLNDYLDKVHRSNGDNNGKGNSTLAPLGDKPDTHTAIHHHSHVRLDQDSTTIQDEKHMAGIDNDTSNNHHPPTRTRYKVAADDSRSSLAHMLYLSLTIPFKLLATEPVVFFFSLWISFAWALLYMTFSVLPLVFSTRHGFTTEQNGAVFAAITIGTVVATVVSIFQPILTNRRWPKLTTSPEGRLYFVCLESALLPVGLFWFGWTTSASVHWISPVLAIGVAEMGIFVIYLAVFNYLADVYHRYASSALAAQSFMRNTLAAVFPLFTDQMFRTLGYPAASSLLGGISAVLTLVPWVLLFNGEKIRARSKIARQIMAHAT